MRRYRHQRGFIFETMGRVRKWAGRFHVYVIDARGTEKRRHKYVTLGLKSEMKRWEAEEKLQRIIAQHSTGNRPATPDPEQTFGWFWKERYVPIKQSKWKRSQVDAVFFVMDKHVLPRFERVRLCDMNKFDIQTHLNELAKRYSESLVDKAYTYINAALEEAVDQDFLEKNPARKVEMPKTRKPAKRHIRPEEIQLLLSELTKRSLIRDRLILRTFIVTALRPGELFAVRWKDLEPGRIRIDEAVYRNKLDDPKTPTSAGYVYIPKSLELELAMWKESRLRTGPEDFVFEARYHGRPMDGRSYLRRFLGPLAKTLGIAGLTYQALRRTFATQVQRLGSVKDAQAQLRHAHASTTLGIYTQEIPESVRETVEALDRKLFGETAEGGQRVN
jgi:integrase